MSDDEARPSVEDLRRMLRQIERRSEAPRRREPVRLEEAVPGREVENERGRVFRIERPAADFLSEEDDFSEAASLFFSRSQVNREALERAGPEVGELAETEPADILFLDIETAGFHGTGLFLIGLLGMREGEFVVDQLFARDYAEEAAVLEELRGFYGAAGVVVTFNGRAFDLPFIEDRAVVHRVELARPARDVDLLHAARRVWRGWLPDCRLVTLEQYVCGRTREGDLASHLIPQAYHDFVETGDARLMRDVVRHNAYDLVTMAHLLARLANG